MPQLTFLWGNGGGVVTAALLMNPHKAPLAAFAKNEVMVVWTVCWWLNNYCPRGLVASITRRWYVQMFTKQGTCLSRALLIISRVDLAVQLYPGVVAAPLILGTLAGCGGRILADILLHSWEELPSHAELTVPAFASRSGFIAASVYYLGAHVLQLASKEAVAGIVVTSLMLHSLLADLLGLPLDFTAPLAQLMHSCCNVPMPCPTNGSVQKIKGRQLGAQVEPGDKGGAGYTDAATVLASKADSSSGSKRQTRAVVNVVAQPAPVVKRKTRTRE